MPPTSPMLPPPCAHLADAQPNTDGFQYDGKVFAVLNDNGTAEWVVFVNDTALQTGTNNNQGGGSGALYNYNSMVTGGVRLMSP